MVHPFQRGYVVGLHVANLVPYMYSVGVRCRAPGNASGDDPPVGSIEDMGIQLKGMETFPFPILQVLEVFEPGVARFSDGTPFTEATDSQKITYYVGDEGLPKMGCLSTFAQVARSIFTRLALTFSQAPRILIQNEQGDFFSFGATKSNLCSGSLDLFRAPVIKFGQPCALGSFSKAFPLELFPLPVDQRSWFQIELQDL